MRLIEVGLLVVANDSRILIGLQAPGGVRVAGLIGRVALAVHRLARHLRATIRATRITVLCGAQGCSTENQGDRQQATGEFRVHGILRK